MKTEQEVFLTDSFKELMKLKDDLVDIGWIKK